MANMANNIDKTIAYVDSLRVVGAGGDAERRIQADITEEEDTLSTADAVSHIALWASEVGSVIAPMLDYASVTQVKPQPELALLSILSILGVNLARRYRGWTNAPSGLYIVALAKSGEGKEHGRRMIKRYLAASLMDKRERGAPTSPGAIFTDLFSCPSPLYSIDEFGRFVAASQSTDQNKAGTATELMKVFGASEDQYATDSYSKKGKDAAEREAMTAEERPWNPVVSTYAVSTMVEFYSSLKSTAVGNGFLNRFLILESSIPRQVGKHRKRRTTPPIPEKYNDWERAAWRRWKNHEGGAEIDDGTSQAQSAEVMLDYTEATITLLEEYDENIKDRCEALDRKGLDGFYARTIEKGLRVALILELSRDIGATHIQDDALKLAMDLTLAADHAFLVRAGVEIHDSESEELQNKMLQYFIDRPGQLVEKRKLSASLKKFKPSDRNAMLNELIEMNEIEIVSDRKMSGQIAKFYRRRSR